LHTSNRSNVLTGEFEVTNVFYFARYSQRENFATNNTLLLMYRLYETSRRRFQEFLTKLLDETADEAIAALGLQMSQQEPSGKSVLDGFLYQSAVRIGIEAKAPGAAFDKPQLMNHLERFDKNGSGYLLLLRPDSVNLTDETWRELHDEAKKRRVISLMTRRSDRSQAKLWNFAKDFAFIFLSEKLAWLKK
jgi:hypothetical protein